MPVKQHEDTLGLDHRVRVTLDLARGQVKHWAVQLEWLDPEEGWVWIVRYDTAGGKAHRDRNRIAAHEPVTLPPLAGKAIQAAKKELITRAEEYTEAYLAAKAAGRERW
jgi:hypothetical protein